MGKVEQIIQAIEDAENLKSKLTPEVLSIGGFTSNKIRHLLNNLGAISTDYFEIGVHRGATFCAAMYRNGIWGTACDNFSQFNEDNAKNEFYKNIASNLGARAVQVLEQDCFTIDPTEHKEIDLYLYDGEHSAESTKKGVTYFYQSFADEFILLMDDYGWTEVQEGTQYGIGECGFEVLFERHLGEGDNGNGEGWWNGFYVALLKKK